jgi:hypothetical protein
MNILFWLLSSPLPLHSHGDSNCEDSLPHIKHSLEWIISGISDLEADPSTLRDAIDALPAASRVQISGMLS